MTRVRNKSEVQTTNRSKGANLSYSLKFDEENREMDDSFGKYLLMAKKSAAAPAAFEAAIIGAAVWPTEKDIIITDVRTMTIVPTLSI